jgi:hypothetical protein
VSDFYNGLGIVVGVLIGIIAGTGISLIVQQVQRNQVEKLWLSYLRYEINLNVQKIDGWEAELGKFRNAVNANNLATYFGYFDVSRFLTVTANNLLNAGLLYKHLTYSEVGELQAASSELSLYGENYMNNQILQLKTQYNQQAAAQFADFLQGMFTKHKDALKRIASRLGV